MNRTIVLVFLVLTGLTNRGEAERRPFILQKGKGISVFYPMGVRSVRPLVVGMLGNERHKLLWDNKLTLEFELLDSLVRPVTIEPDGN